MSIDWSISFGNVLTLVAMLVGVVTAVLSMRSDIRMLAQGLSRVEKDLNRVADVLVQLARQEERLSAADRRINDLSVRVFKIEALGVDYPNGNR